VLRKKTCVEEKNLRRGEKLVLRGKTCVEGENQCRGEKPVLNIKRVFCFFCNIVLNISLSKKN
jgi:hypothetical protein